MKRVNRVHQFLNFRNPVSIAIQAAQSRALDNWNVVAVEVVEREQFADFHFHELEQLRVIDHVHFVHEHHQLRNTYLTSEQDVLTGLGHWAVSSSYYEDSAVHLGSTRYHVLHIVSVTGAVNVGVVTVFGSVLNVSRVDGDTTLFFLGSIVDRGEVTLFGQTLVCQYHGDSSGQGRFAVVDVADGTDVHVRLGPVKIFFSHCKEIRKEVVK